MMEDNMQWTQAITIIVTVLVPMMAGFGWVIHRLSMIETRVTVIETRVTVIETVLAMMGMPVKPGKEK